MNIGFDFDGIFIDSPPIIPKWILEMLYRDNSKKNLWYRIPTPREQKIRLLIHHPLLRPPITKNITFIKNRKDPKNNYYVISSRYSFLKGKTKDLIQKHGLSGVFKDLFFNFDDKQPHVFKNEMIKKNNIKKYIDDDLFLLQYISKKNPQTMFYWLNRNKNDRLGKNLISITHISSIFAK